MGGLKLRPHCTRCGGSEWVSYLGRCYPCHGDCLIAKALAGLAGEVRDETTDADLLWAGADHHEEGLNHEQEEG